jgi:hypothetical protein
MGPRLQTAEYFILKTALASRSEKIYIAWHRQNKKEVKMSSLTGGKKPKEVSVGKTGRRRELFKDSEYHDFETFYLATRRIPLMASWSRESCLEIHQTLQEWSGSKGVKRHDWLATARTIERRMRERREGEDRRLFPRQAPERRKSAEL